MVPDSTAAGDVGSNGLPKNHPQESNKYLFSIDVKHESNHPEMSLNSSAFVPEASSAPSSSPSPEDSNTALSISRRKNKVRSNLALVSSFSHDVSFLDLNVFDCVTYAFKIFHVLVCNSSVTHFIVS
jgi:hypothetical protein